jgi:hypothetical protein
VFPHEKLVAPPFYSAEKGGLKVQTLVSILATAFLAITGIGGSHIQFIYSVGYL